VFSPSTEPLRELAAACRTATAVPRRRVAAASLTLMAIAAALLARAGTPRARIAAGAAIAIGGALVLLWEWLDKKRLAGPDAVLRRIVKRVDATRADRALRALSLVSAAGATYGVSQELAKLHVARALADVPNARVLERVASAAGRASALAVVVGLGVIAVALVDGWSILEGADVLLARGAVAPFSMQWLDGIELTARPPDYLHETEIHEVALSSLVLPFGTEIALRGAPVRSGRRLLLTDGVTEVPFVEDGAGALVARWRLADTTTLRVIARFGAVAIEQADRLPVQSIPDAAPLVELESAPREVRLADQVEDIPIRYRATDDHGLREVQLVLRSGAREERRVLSRLDGETQRDEGGQVLRLRDPFLRRSHAPIAVSVEAKDNDPLSGPKWGASAAITVIPADVGEPEARRIEALRRVRDALVDSLAWRLGAPVRGLARAPGASHAADETKRAAADDQILDDALAQTYGGLTVPARTRALLTAQRAKVRSAVDAESRAPSERTHAATTAATERFALVIDAIVRGLAVRQTHDAARQLVDVAEDLVSGAAQAQADAADTRARGTLRMDAAEGVLRAGARNLQIFGALGRDIGEIVTVDCARVDRARTATDLVHAELAARDLAARLHQPDPSFGARGTAQRGGGESGGGRGTEEDEAGEPDDVEQAFDEAKGELDRLSQDHAGAVGKTEQLLAGAGSDEEQSGLRDEAKRHAQAIRDAASSLPAVGGGSDSWTSKGAAARELAEQAARSLEESRPEEAAQAGRAAVSSLQDAKRMLEGSRHGRGWTDDLDALGDPKKVEEVAHALEAEARWAEDQVRRLRAAAAQRARAQLERGGQEEDDMANRARDLAQRSRERGSLPEEAIESIDDAERSAREAAGALKDGDAERGLERQHQAQRDLDAARARLQDDSEKDDGESRMSSNDEGGRRGASANPVDIPHDHKGPEDFRRRVVRGLGQASNGSLKDAVQRYAEGLLR
jgi:hypothetical protein